MTELKSVAYSGEDYLPVYHGDTWMMAIGKIDFLREDEEKNK